VSIGVAMDFGGVREGCHCNARPIVIDGAGCQGSFTLASESTWPLLGADIDAFRVSAEVLGVVFDASLSLGPGQATDTAFEICFL